ncbi:hypothetical protein [Kibdelosporangium persicum]|uniref:hypothetical protein n=1 Tax=Kibdelosporangium persicum TaxID=2698649 RepID=UPI0015677D3F|nr:hypothetical protein [Kibdelosporangium persicum]
MNAGTIEIRYGVGHRQLREQDATLVVRLVEQRHVAEVQQVETHEPDRRPLTLTIE